ncbi:hypothetical protein [Fundidesulfovibrio putealis]|uniref:hypothetical protein n=1 Tax=Fundidesulfovibrio putealis TaxID=270496 RepID=UPI0012EC1609|nr:hypothetical protein [Fundidesulfovibrio putealis]
MKTPFKIAFPMRSLILSALKLTAPIAFLLFGAIVLLGIYDCHPTAEDVSRLQTLSDRYPRYKLSFDCDLYLKVMALDPLSPHSDQTVIDIYNIFFAKDDGKLKRDTPFVYVNFYNNKGDFQYQLIHDWQINDYVMGNREFY